MTKTVFGNDRRLSDKQLFERIFAHVREEDRKRFRSCKRVIARAKKEHLGTLCVVVPDHRAAQILVKLLEHRHNGFSAHYKTIRLPENELRIEVVVAIKLEK